MTEQGTFDFNEWQRGFCNDAEKPENANSTIRHLLSSHRMLPQIVCADGFTMSVQASEFHYCEPRHTDEPFYSAVEVGFPSEKQDELMEWAESPDNPTGTVYGWVPVEVINALVAKHGGMK
mgnify:CR=1 FL=1